MKSKTTAKFWRVPLDAERMITPHGSPHILEERCKGCAFCIEFCPCGVLVHSDRYNHKGYHPPDIENVGECRACGLCELLCPEFAIAVVKEQAEVPDAR